MKRTRRDASIGIVIHIQVETMQGNSLCSYIYFKLAKSIMFLFLSFIFFLLQNQRTGSSQGCMALVGRGRWQG
jgi:hypothetical protein